MTGNTFLNYFQKSAAFVPSPLVIGLNASMNPSDELIPTRWTLLSRLKDAGDADSWQEFFDTYWRLIYGVAVKSGLTDAEAQEVVQEVVIGVARKMPEFRCDPAAGSFKGWLLQVTRRRIVDQFRKRRPWSPTQSPRVVDHPGRALASPRENGTARTSTVERVPDPASYDLEAAWDNEWRQHLLDRALARVKQTADPEQYQMFDLQVRLGLPAREVARKLEVSRARVYVAKYKIGALLKREAQRIERQEGAG
jgi:RNA polymerase sigma factor (sigma-70 family)